MSIYSCNHPFRFSLSQFNSDFSWAFNEIRSTRKDSSLTRAIRFSIHTLFSIKSSAIWLRLLRERSLVSTPLIEATFIDRLHRPFFDRRLNLNQRGKLLCNHFSILFQLFDPQQLHLVHNGSGITLATLTGKAGETMEIRMVRIPGYDKEGGTSIVLAVNGRQVQTLTFTFARQQRRRVVKIGGIQARRYPDMDSRTLVRDATTALHGIQPRILLIEVIRNLAKEFEIESIEGINENNHICRALRYNNSRKIYSQYNQFWSMVGGAEMADKNFAIPVTMAEKPIESRPARKRNEYRQRAALYDAMWIQMTNKLRTKLV